jgi:hypothetical protein
LKRTWDGVFSSPLPSSELENNKFLQITSDFVTSFVMDYF